MELNESLLEWLLSHDQHVIIPMYGKKNNKIAVNRMSTKVQGPVVQSMVSLTSSLRAQLVKCFMTF